MKNKKSTGKTKSPNFGWAQNRRLHILLLILTVSALYLRIGGYEYVGLDDTSFIQDNFEFISDLGNLPKAFAQDLFKIQNDFDKNKDYYRPLFTVSFMLDSQISGRSPKFYHISNVIYHAIACVLLYFLLIRLGASAAGAFLLGMIFAVHPLNTQALGWIPGRNDILLSIFIIAALIYFIKYIENRTYKNLLLHLLFFACSLFTKENAVFIVFLTAFYYKFIRKEKFLVSENILLTAAHISIAAVWFIARSAALSGSASNQPVFGLLKEIAGNYPLLFQYLGKTIFPFDLSALATAADTNYIWGISAIALITISIAFYKKRDLSLQLFGIIWFIVFIIPSFAASYFSVLENRAYLPLMGIIVIASGCDNVKSLKLSPKFYIPALIVMIIFAVIANSRIPIYKNRFAFYQSAVSTSSHSVQSCLNLGKHLEEIGKYGEAIRYYRMGLDRDSTFRNLHNNIGGAYLYLKNYSLAEPEFKAELRLHPDNVNSIYNLGLVYKNTGRLALAIPQWNEALRRDPDFIYAYKELAGYYSSIRDTANFLKCAGELKKRGY